MVVKIGDDWSLVALELPSPSGHGGRKGVLNLGPGTLSLSCFPSLILSPFALQPLDGVWGVG